MAEPSQEAIAACDEFILDELYHAFRLDRSYARQRDGSSAARRS